VLGKFGGMSDLVKTLKDEHTNIHKILVKVGELGIDNDDGHKALMAAKAGILAHLEREDKYLYPTLLNAAEDDSFLRDILDIFYENIESVAKAALGFFDKYEAGTRSDSFAVDFSELVCVLTQRIKKEESVIYKIFDQLEM
jgi:hemerythrin-like domain-containing protein